MNFRLKHILYFLLIGFVIADQNQSKKDLIDEALNHATTYYWLARYKDSNSQDFQKAKFWYQKAIELIDSDTLENYYDLRAIAIKGLNEADVHHENNFDNIHNDYPLFDIINKNNPTYEFYDDPNIVAVAYAIDDALNLLQYSNPKDDIQMMSIVISDPENFPLEDELRFQINTKPQYFTRPSEEILSSITKEELKILYQFPQNPKSLDIMNRLAKDWDQRHIMVFKLIKNDIVENVYYFGIWAYLYDKDKGKINKSAYSDGFAEDKRHIRFQKLLLLLFIIAISTIFPLIYSRLYPILFKSNKRPIFIYTSLFSFFLTFITNQLLILSFQLWAPEPSTLSILPINRIWIFSFTLALSAIPLVLIYLIGSRFKGIKDRISDGETLACLAGGALLGNLFAMGIFYIERFELFEFMKLMPLIIWPIIASTMYLGYGISSKFYNNYNKHLVAIPIYIVISYLLNITFLSDDNLYLIIAFIISIFFPFSIFSFLKIKNYYQSQNSKLDNVSYIENISKDTYNEILDKPNNFIESVVGKNIRKQYAEYLFSLDETSNKINSKLKTILITGNSGCGKTRLAIEIAEEAINNYNKQNNIEDDSVDSNNWVLFGDCDEMASDGSGVPFEPFSQALHSILGAGRFEPPAKRANKIKAGFEKLGMEDALGAAGLGVMNSILGSGDSEEITPATSVEMAEIVEKSLLKLAENRPVVFIIDDTHWIDDQTFALFKELLKRLSSQSNVENISLIVTANENFNSKGSGRCAKMLKTFGPNKLLSLYEIKGENFLGSDRFEELLTRALYIENQSAARIMRYLNKYNVSNISDVIRVVNQINSKDALEFSDSKVYVKSNFKISSLKPPSDTMLQVSDLLSSLEPEEKRIIECAAFIGTEVNASTITTALQTSRLKTLVSLRRLEKKGLIKDVLDQDDVYAFTSSSLLNGIRYITSNNNNMTSNISQIVREYQRRITISLEKKYDIQIDNMETIKEIRDHTIFKLAKRSMAAGEFMLDKALFYNQIAQDRAIKTKFYFDAINFGINIIEIYEKLNKKPVDEKIAKSIFATLASMTNTNHSPNKIIKFYERSHQIFSNHVDQEVYLLKLNNLFTDAIIHDFSNYYKSSTIEKLITELNELIEKVDKGNNQLEILFGELSLLRLKKQNKTIEALENLLLKADNISSEESVWFQKRLKSEIIEEIIQISSFSKDSEQLIKLFENGIEIKKEINDQEGLCQLLLFQSDYLFQTGGDIDQIEKYYLEAEKISKNIGSMDFASDSHSGLGNVYFMKKDYAKSLSQFSKACVESKIDDNIPNQYVALIGIHKILEITKDKEIFIEFSDEVEHVINKDKEHGENYNELIRLVELVKDSI